MKNIWLHSALVVLLGALLLVAAAMTRASSAALPSTMTMLSLLVPGLLLGWFTRRHPLVVGALAALLAAVIAGRVLPHSVGATSVLDATLAAGLVVAVAALAGRALRYRFQDGKPGEG
jgi:hypothetical protein